AWLCGLLPADPTLAAGLRLSHVPGQHVGLFIPASRRHRHRGLGALRHSRCLSTGGAVYAVRTVGVGGGFGAGHGAGASGGLAAGEYSDHRRGARARLACLPRTGAGGRSVVSSRLHSYHNSTAQVVTVNVVLFVTDRPADLAVTVALACPTQLVLTAHRQVWFPLASAWATACRDLPPAVLPWQYCIVMVRTAFGCVWTQTCPVSPMAPSAQVKVSGRVAVGVVLPGGRVGVSVARFVGDAVRWPAVDVVPPVWDGAWKALPMTAALNRAQSTMLTTNTPTIPICARRGAKR